MARRRKGGWKNNKNNRKNNNNEEGGKARGELRIEDGTNGQELLYEVD